MDQNNNANSLPDTDNNAIDSGFAENSGYSEAAPESASGFDDPVDIESMDMANHAEERMKRKGSKGLKICNASCVAGGILGSVGVSLCAAAVCILVGSIKDTTYAVGFPNGSIVESVSSDGNGGYDVGLGNGGSPFSGDISQAGTGTSNGDPIISSSSTSEKPVSSSPATESRPVSSSSTGISSSSIIETKPVSSSTTSDSGPAMPGTGEFGPERVTALMESELLRAQEKRISEGKSRYLPSDIAMDARLYAVSDICDIYGFSEGFVFAYNDMDRSGVPDTVRVPRI